MKPKILIVRTDATNKDFIELVKHLDDELAERDAKDHTFYNQFNQIDAIRHVLVLYENELPVACGALKSYKTNTVEIKRMFTLPKNRGQGFASQLLIELECWARELGYKKCILETGKRQPEAIALYNKRGFKIILNYGQYAEIENSVCFEKFI